MRFLLLGPLSISDDDRPIVLNAAYQRAILALLLVNANRVMSAARIMEEIWGDNQPQSGTSALRYHVHAIRQTLGPDHPLKTSGSGYAIEVDVQTCDALRFEHLVERGRAEMEDGDLDSAAATLRDALGLWRGPPLDEFLEWDFAAREAERLNEVRRVAEGDLAETELATTSPIALVPKLQSLVEEFPLDERLRGLLMTALYHGGRQSDALRVYRQTSQLLADELGIEPSPALRELEEKMLFQQHELDTRLPSAPIQLPTYMTRLVGRERELDRLTRLLDRERLVTVVGPGGVGKTRLAIEAARRLSARYRHGIAMVDLSDVGESAGIDRSVAAALGIQVPPGFKPLTSVVEHLAKKEVLLVLDNCEALADAATRTVLDLIKRTPAVSVLATSREPLRAQVETIYRLQPLAIDSERPDEASEAVQLFIDAATRRGSRSDLAEPDLDIAERICRQLDGIPLAIELAAARSRTLPLAEIERLLRRGIGVLSSDMRSVDARHRTMAATLDWSFDNLDEPAQRLLVRLSVFVGGFDFEAARELNRWLAESHMLMILTQLVDASLVVLQEDDSERYRMLNTIREYVEARGHESELSEARSTHAKYYADLVSQLAVPIGMPQSETTARLVMDQANAGAAFDRSMADGDAVTALRIGSGMGDVWFHHGDHESARERLRRAVAEAVEGETAFVLRSLWHLIRFATWLGDKQEAAHLTDRMRETARTESDTDVVAQSIAFRAVIAWANGELSRSRRLLGEALQSAPQDSPHRARWLAQMSYLSSWMGDTDSADQIIAELELLRMTMSGAAIDAFIADAKGTVDLQRGKLESAAMHFREARHRYRDADLSIFVCDMLQSEANALIDLGRSADAQPLAAQALKLAAETNDPRMRARSILTRGRISLAQGRLMDAEEELLAAGRLSLATGDSAGVVLAVLSRATVATLASDYQRALALHAYRSSVQGELQLPAAAEHQAVKEIAEARSAIGEELAERLWNAAGKRTYAFITDDLGTATAQLEVPSS